MTNKSTYKEALSFAREIYDWNAKDWNSDKENWQAYPEPVFAMAQLLEDLYGFDAFAIADEIVAD